MTARSPLVAPLVTLVGALTALGTLAVPASPASAQPTSPAAARPAAVSAAPTSSVLISEVANGGGGATTDASRVSADDFMEIGNFGAEAVDVSGWRILRCGQTGDAYGPQKVIPAGTVLQPGEKYTIGSPTSTNKAVVTRDADYDATGSTLHEFGFGAWLETPSYDVVDRVGFYAPSVFSDCGQRDANLPRPLDHRLNQSHQRVAATGDPAADWVVSTRTPDAANATTPAPGWERGPVKISEVANGDHVSDAHQYVELTNYGAEPVDVTGWKLYRCGENGTAYVQNPSLPAGSVIAPGASYVIAHASGTLPGGASAQATFPGGMHWRDFGALVVRPDERIVDGVGFYDDRLSVCSDGSPQAQDASSLQDESYHRVSATGDSSADFMLARERTPGVASAAGALTAPAAPQRGDLRISELVGSGPAGANDEIIELANYGSAPLNLAGYSLIRCEGTGKGNAGTQVADLGDVTLPPGGVWTATDDGAPAALRAIADATYPTGLADTAFGAYVTDPQGRMVDAVGVYETVTYSPCVAFGSSLRAETKNDLGESYQRARSTADDEENFVKAKRTPGVLADQKWVDPTQPLPGELDRVELEQVTVPGTPRLTGRATGGGYQASVTTTDADGGDLDVSLRAATPLDVAGTRIWAGATARKVPANLAIVGERRVATAPALTTRGGTTSYPFQRYQVPVTGAPADLEFTWTGTGEARDELQMYAWNGTQWQLLTAAAPSADGDVTLLGRTTAAHVVDGALNVLVIDGPRSAGGAVDEIGVADQKFLDPEQYDFAFNHATDTQFLSEGFRDVYRTMATWVVANADARKIGYATNTGDLIENWIGGNADPVRARKEFAAAKRIQQLLNDADIPNGVLPGNHDNLWGRNNDLYNEYFGPEMYRDESWWGDSWKPGDNSAHYDFVEAAGLELLMLNLPYRPTQEQIDWAAEVAAAYPEHNVVLLTHSYLTTEKEIENRDNRYTARGEDIWTDLVAPSDNIFLVLGGHYHGVATKYGDPVTGEHVDAIPIAGDAVAVRNTGATGRTVVQMLADYQGYRSTQPGTRADTLDRDTGFMRLLQFDFDSELMAVNAYSPHLSSFEAWRYDEPAYRGDNARYTATDDEFVAKVDLLQRRSVTTTAWGLTEAPSEVGTATVAAGAPARVLATGLAEGDVLHAVVTDTTGNVVTSAPHPVSLEATQVATTTSLTASRTTQAYGAPAAARVVLSARVAVSGGGPAEGPDGMVELRDGGRLLARRPLAAGEASYVVPSTLSAGSHAITATYLPAEGAPTAGSTSSAVRVTVRKAAATTSARLVRGTVPPRARGRLVVRVAASGVVPTGRVAVRVAGGGGVRTVAARLRGGRVVVTLPRLARGTYRVTATYAGSATVAADVSRRVRLTVR